MMGGCLKQRLVWVSYHAPARRLFQGLYFGRPVFAATSLSEESGPRFRAMGRGGPLIGLSPWRSRPFGISRGR